MCNLHKNLEGSAASQLRSSGLANKGRLSEIQACDCHTLPSHGHTVRFSNSNLRWWRGWAPGKSAILQRPLLDQRHIIWEILGAILVPRDLPQPGVRRVTTLRALRASRPASSGLFHRGCPDSSNFAHGIGRGRGQRLRSSSLGPLPRSRHRTEPAAQRHDVRCARAVSTNGGLLLGGVQKQQAVLLATRAFALRIGRARGA
mmetsp:Transcript_8833/g.22266  ORF Transcript_8833/g.22266 Transcript_8833/m.22266 type:complete len:202 (-) Transcript_8833:794-1399(-)